MSTTTPLPTTEQQQRAKWDLILLDLELRADQIRALRSDQTRAARQARWEVPKAVAMIALALAAIAAAGRLADAIYPPRAQQISVHLDQPIGAGK